jgi:hypothetical protein
LSVVCFGTSAAEKELLVVVESPAADYKETEGDELMPADATGP